MQRLIASLLITACASTAQADGLQALESFVKSAHSGRAEFTQIVSAPAREGQGVRSKTSTGTFEFARPGRFKFLYKKPFEQSIIADGQTLWLYDVDLNQVTARKQASALGSTPAALIAAAPDLRDLKKDYTLNAAPDADGLQWVLAQPKAPDGQVQAVRVGFRVESSAKVAELAALEILDNFGQRSVLRFSKVEVNPALPADNFAFKPPVGADVVRQ